MDKLQIFQIQGLFAPFVAVLAGSALLLLSRYNRGIQYLPYFAFSLFSFAAAVVFSQIVFEKMTIANAVASSTMYFTTSGFMVHAAMSRLGDRLNIPLHLCLMTLDIAGRILILQLGFSATTYLIFVNTVMAAPLAIAAGFLLKHENKDIQAISLAVAYGAIAAMAIFITPLVLLVGGTVTGENYFSTYYWTLLTILTVFGICLMISSFAFTLGRDLLLLKENEASKDFLSGLLTRRAFEKESGELLEACQNDAASIGLIMCDIDHFKRINDNFGHDAGDKVIKAFGSLILENLPDHAVAGRTGGEEFAIVVSGCDIRSTRLLAEGLRTAISTLVFEGIPAEKRITASFGVTVLRTKEQLSTAFKRADEALYEAKNAGRDKVIASSLLASEVPDRLQSSVV